tara:strand:- start:57 stop:422 length:366 start_codon:yes stop_codon:yes gene_type:complete
MDIINKMNLNKLGVSSDDITKLTNFVVKTDNHIDYMCYEFDQKSIKLIKKKFKISKKFEEQDQCIKDLYNHYEDECGCDTDDDDEAVEWCEDNETRKKIKNILIGPSCVKYRENMDYKLVL